MAWLGTWAKRVQITIDSTDIDSALSDFPILIKLSSSCGQNNEDLTFVFDEVGASKLKIALTKDDGTTQLQVEIEDWDNGSEVAFLWAKIPDIASGADTDLYLYYDSAQADNTTYIGDPESAAAEQVWDSNFIMAQDMQDYDTSNVHDSTDNDNDGAKLAADEPVEADGQIYKGQDFDGSDDYIDCGNAASFQFTDEITLEAWIKADTIGGVDSILTKYGDANFADSWIFAIVNTRIRFYLDIGGFKILEGSILSTGTWYHLVATYDGSDMKIYIDGVEDDTQSQSGSFDTSTSTVKIGRSGDLVDTEIFEGIIDGVRISDIGRSAAWIKATYETGIDDLLDFGSEEEMPAVGQPYAMRIQQVAGMRTYGGM